MIEITEVNLSKQTAETGEMVIVTIVVRETLDYPYDYPHDYPIVYVGNGQ